MRRFFGFSTSGWMIIASVLVLTILSNIVLYSIYPIIYPGYLIYIFIGIIVFIIAVKIDFEVYSTFSIFFYWISILFLIITLILGQVTRGSIRWVPLGSLTLQPSEVFRSFILLYLAKFASEKELNTQRIFKLVFLFSIPFILILVQPSLGVAVVMSVGFLGILLASDINKKIILFSFVIFILVLPLFWFFLAPYQKERVMTFINPYKDPLGAGYNSIQSMISVGSGKLIGRGLGQGVQTQLAYLPERHTDFIFASISEEMGFLGAALILISLMIIFVSFINIIENSIDKIARIYVTSVFFIFLIQTFIHIGMNMGIVPITGLPLPFVSVGGSALVGAYLMLALTLRSEKIS